MPRKAHMDKQLEPAHVTPLQSSPHRLRFYVVSLLCPPSHPCQMMALLHCLPASVPTHMLEPGTAEHAEHRIVWSMRGAFQSRQQGMTLVGVRLLVGLCT